MTTIERASNTPSQLHSYYTTHPCPLGMLIIVASARGIQVIDLLEEAASENAWLEDFEKQRKQQPLHMPGFFQETLKAIDNYFEQSTPLHLPFEFAWGTALQRAVWMQIAKIPFGKTVTYTELAEKVGFPRAIRAVASACGANPIPILVPCHRVIAKDGSLGGFSLGGIGVKEKLLALESEQLPIAC